MHIVDWDLGWFQVGGAQYTHSCTHVVVYVRRTICGAGFPWHDAGSGVEDHPSDKAGMTCIWEGHAKSKFRSPSITAQEGSSGNRRNSQWEAVHQGWGKERDPSSRIPSPQVLGMLFLAREPAIPVQPPSRPSALFSTATSKQAASSTNLQASPAQPALLQLPTAPCPRRNVRSGRWQSSRGGQGTKATLAVPSNKHTLARCVPTFAFTTRTINITVFVALVSTYTQPDCIHQTSLVPTSRISHLIPRSCTTCTCARLCTFLPPASYLPPGSYHCHYRDPRLPFEF